jgi:hypothetical protein
MASGFAIAVVLEDQLHLNEQTALHEAVCCPSSEMVVDRQLLLGPHQRHLEADAPGSLQTRLKVEAPPLLCSPHCSTARELDAISYLVCPAADQRLNSALRLLLLLLCSGLRNPFSAKAGTVPDPGGASGTLADSAVGGVSHRMVSGWRERQADF